jgi:signal transduction histidine kinase/CheY-like chemotaxis protein
MHATSDFAIFSSYLAISAVIAYLVFKIKSIPFNLVYMLFSIFIFACGLTHLMEIINIWIPTYGLSGLVKVVTAVASVGTAILLPTYVPKIETLLKNSSLLRETELRLVRDIEKRKVVEQDLIEALAAAKMANLAKSEFLANISHEIRTPMNIIVGISEILEESPLNAEQQRYVGMFRKAGNNLLTIINDLLDVSKMETGNLVLESTVIAVKGLTDEIVQLCSPNAAAKKLNLSLNVDKNTPENVIGDGFRIRQVLLNLVGNAIKFTHSGSIWINIRPNQDLSRKGNLLFSVVDTGIGISGADAEKLFLPFSQANSSITKNYGGTGLGLSLCQQLVKLMGGEIWFSSIKGIGTEFFFTINCQPTNDAVNLETADDRERNFQKISGSGRALEILLVDDSEDNRILVQAFLNDVRYKVTEAVNGEVAVAAVKAKRFDLILMDMQMPILDGYSATREIRLWETANSLPRTPIIALTAYAFTEERLKSAEAGCDEHLTKPVTKIVLQKRLAVLTAAAHRIEHTSTTA